MVKGYPIFGWDCDISGTQEREQTGRSNIFLVTKYLKDKYGMVVKFKFRQSAIVYGIALLRSYIKNMEGKCRMFFDERKCPILIDQLKNYRYPEKDGEVTSELPIKLNDDGNDSLRYYAVNVLDDIVKGKRKITQSYY
jgi:hypothetical protein